MTETPQQAYISKVHLKGYKSIRDLEIDFKPGLNIIIGPNGSGKTNFLEFLKNSLERNYIELNGNFSFTFKFENINISTWEVSYTYKRHNNHNIIKEIFDDKKPFNIVYPDNSKLKSLQNIGGITPYIEVSELKPFCKINYNTPLNIPLLDSPYSTDENQLFNFPQFASFEEFIDKKLNHISYSLQGFSQEIAGENLSAFFKADVKMIENLQRFSPIKNFEISESARYIPDNNQYHLAFLSYVFFVNDKWLTWKQLSDGTKRLFYIIHEVTYFERGIYLIEEPELGIHPDQLYKLMDFLKEQSKEKQIIITTHSPDVLNILGADELDRIIVTKNDNEKGTIMRKLQLPQIEKARRYMESAGLFLSDYWVHSDLEAAAYETEEED